MGEQFRSYAITRDNKRNGQEFEQAPGADDGQGNPLCRSPWGHKESDTTE